MTDQGWSKTLSILPITDLKTALDDPTHTTRDARIGLDAERSYRRRAAGREFLDLSKVANAAKALDHLPAAGETQHLIMSGNFDGFDLVPAILRLAAPARIRELWVATLGYNEKNTAALVELLDANQIRRCHFICSIYFKSMADGGRIYQRLHHELTSRGHRLIAIRNHAKVLAVQLTDCRCIVVESSANLRSCRNIEQCTITADAGLFQFHTAWMQDCFCGCQT